MIHQVVSRLAVIGCCALIVGCSGIGSLNTSNQTAKRMYRKLPHYASLSHQDWQPLHLKRSLKLGRRNVLVPEVRRRLTLLGDMRKSSHAASQMFDAPLATAVRHFQWRHGLRADGKVGKATMAVLNITPRQRLRKLKLNMARWAKFPENEGSHYIRVNTASFRLNLIKDGHKVLDLKVIAGKPSRETPELYSKIRTIVFNPKWNVPNSIATKDIVPKMVENPNYLAENNIQIYSSWRKDAYIIDPKTLDWHDLSDKKFPYRLTQASGNENALGRVKFVFLNKHDVYMHDTPQKGLFSKIQRAFSSGCIRLEQPFRLVEYFIQNQASLKMSDMDKHLSAGKMRYVRIDKPVPIFITYITAWVDKRGVSHFREDIYKRDG